MLLRYLIVSTFFLTLAISLVGCGDTAPVAPKPPPEDAKKMMEGHEKK